MRIIGSVEINSPPEKVFPWLENPEKAMKWQMNVAGGEILKETPDVVGTTFRERLEEKGRGTEMTGVITEYVRDRRIAFHLDGDFNTVDVVFALEPSGDVTRLFRTVDVRFKSFLRVTSVLLGPLMKRKIMRQLELEFRKLKELCEREESSLKSAR